MTTLSTSDVPPRRRGRRFGWVVLALFFVVVALPIVGFVRDQLVPPPPDGIAWHSDFDAARRDAQSSNRPLLVDVTATWCPPCKVMKRSTWPDARVGQLVRERFVPVRLDADVPAHQPIAAHYGAVYLPTVLVLEPDGRVRDIATKYDADAMAEFLTKASEASPATGAPSPPTAAASASRDALIPGKGEPAFALWDGGVYLLGRPPRVLFAAWPDGTIVREAAGPTSAAATGVIAQDLRVGHARPEEVQALLDETVAAGFDSLPTIHTVVADGASQIIEVRRDGRTRLRAHDPTTRAAADRDASSSPSPAEVAAYAELWRRVGVAIERIRPANEQPLHPAAATADAR